MSCKKDLMRYLPSYWHEVKEMLYLTETETIEFQELCQCIQKTEAEHFLQSMSSYGIKRMEKILGIKVDPAKDLEQRRLLIQLMLSSMIPYTYSFYVDKFNLYLGEGNWDMEYDLENTYFELHVEWVQRHLQDTMQWLLEKVLPAHVGFLMELMHRMTGTVYAGVVYSTEGETEYTAIE